jgi:drug/metabolite transporter (DMT)-like permease
MRVGNPSVVASFRYARLLFSLLVGVFVFDESVDALTLTGSAIIITTGLYTFLREHQIVMASKKLATPL